MVIKMDKDGFIPIEPFIDVLPAIKNAVYYRLFPKKGHIVVRFYDKSGKWIKASNNKIVRV